MYCVNKHTTKQKGERKLKIVNTLFLNLIYSMTILVIITGLIMYNENYFQNVILADYRLSYYVAITIFLFLILPFSNIILFKYLYNSEKIQQFFLKISDKLYK